MIVVHRTETSNPDFVELTNQLSLLLVEVNGESEDFYARLNRLATIPYAVIAEVDGVAVGCGALRPKDQTSIEVKRMFTHPEFRGQGVAQAVLSELEEWAKELGFERLLLETSKSLDAANRLYAAAGYQIIPNYPPYDETPESICFAKKIRN